MAAELISAGFLPRTPPSSTAVPITSRPGSGFEAGGALDTCAPSESLARLADAVTRDGRLAQLTPAMLADLAAGAFTGALAVLVG